MSEEKFRQWIIILFALFILTMWAGIILKINKKDIYPAMRERNMMRQYPNMPMNQRMMQPTMRRPLATKGTSAPTDSSTK